MFPPRAPAAVYPWLVPPLWQGALQLMALNAPPEGYPAKTTMPRAYTQGTTFLD